MQLSGHTGGCDRADGAPFSMPRALAARGVALYCSLNREPPILVVTCAPETRPILLAGEHGGIIANLGETRNSSPDSTGDWSEVKALRASRKTYTF